MSLDAFIARLGDAMDWVFEFGGPTEFGGDPPPSAAIASTGSSTNSGSIWLPVMLGGGVRFFDRPGKLINLETVSAIRSGQVSTLRFRAAR